MKKLFLAILILISISGFSQPIVNRAGQANTVADYRLQATYNFFIPRYLDTTAANILKGIDSCGALIYTYDANNFWYRQCSPKKWVQFSSNRVPIPGDTTIYYNWQVGGNLFVREPADGIKLGTLAPYNGALHIITSSVDRFIVPENGLLPMSASDDSILVRDVNGNLGLAPKSAGGTIDTSFLHGRGVAYYQINGTADSAILVLNDSSRYAVPIGGGGWSLTGDSGTTPGTNFIGTTDAQSLVFKVGDSVAGVIQKRLSGAYSIGSVALGMGALKNSYLSESYANTAIGSGALQEFVGAGGSQGATTAIGRGAGRDNKYGYRNVFVGEYAGFQGWGGDHNTFTGTFAGEVFSGGVFNTGFGAESLRGIKQASYTSGLGGYALRGHTTIVDSVTITNGGSGYTTASCTFSAPESASPGTSSVTATGTVTLDAGVVTGIIITNHGSGYSNEKSTVTITITGDGVNAAGTVVLRSGTQSTATGWAAGWQDYSGKNNTYNGAFSGGSAVNYYDEYNTYLGAYAIRNTGVSGTTKIEKSTAVGYGAIISQSNSIILGDTSTPTKIGIGTSFPAAILHTVGTVRHASLGTASSDTTTKKPLGINSSGDIIPMTYWPGGGGSGTVTNVSGTEPVQVATGTSTPVISMKSFNTTDSGWVKASGSANKILHGDGTWKDTTAVSGVYVPIAGGTMTGKLVISPSSGANELLLDAVAGNNVYLQFAAGTAKKGVIYMEYGSMDLVIAPNNGFTNKIRILNSNGNIGIKNVTPTAYFHIAAGTATASTAPLKINPGLKLTTAEDGAIVYDTTGSVRNLLFDVSTTHYVLPRTLINSATLDFGSTAASTSTDLTITVTGAADGDVVMLGVPNGSVSANSCYTAWVSAADTVTVRFNNYQVVGAIDPASGVFKVSVIK